MALVTRSVESVIDLRPDKRQARELRRRSSSGPYWLLRELHRPAAFLLPMRVFISVGWLRSFFEKVGDPTWISGQAVGEFLDRQVRVGAVPVPTYDWLIDSILRPGSALIGWLAMLLQLAIGLAVLTGTYSNLALLIGIVLNVNFMLTGEVNPSAFYIVIQIVLFVTGAGGVLGFDHRLARRKPAPSLLCVARPDPRDATDDDRSAITLLALQAALVSWVGFSHVSDFSPTGVTDPGLVLGTVMAVTVFSLLILRLRLIDLGRRRSPATTRVR